MTGSSWPSQCLKGDPHTLTTPRPRKQQCVRKGAAKVGPSGLPREDSLKQAPRKLHREGCPWASDSQSGPAGSDKRSCRAIESRTVPGWDRRSREGCFSPAKGACELARVISGYTCIAGFAGREGAGNRGPELRVKDKGARWEEV